jgi:hypothetical protein
MAYDVILLPVPYFPNRNDVLLGVGGLCAVGIPSEERFGYPTVALLHGLFLCPTCLGVGMAHWEHVGGVPVHPYPGAGRKEYVPAGTRWPGFSPMRGQNLEVVSESGSMVVTCPQCKGVGRLWV